MIWIGVIKRMTCSSVSSKTLFTLSPWHNRATQGMQGSKYRKTQQDKQNSPILSSRYCYVTLYMSKAKIKEIFCAGKCCFPVTSATSYHYSFAEAPVKLAIHCSFHTRLALQIVATSLQRLHFEKGI